MGEFIIYTRRLFLRTFKQTDKTFLFNLNNDKIVNKYRTRDSVTIDECIESIQNWNKRFKQGLLNVYLVELLETNSPIGLVSLVQNASGKIELGYRFDKKYWRSGYCKESVQVLIGIFFDKFPDKTIYAETHPDNFKSINFLKKMEFEEINQNEKERGRLFELRKK